jgi:hypothetical protein
MVDCEGNELWRKDKAGYGQPIRLKGREPDFILTRPPDRPYTILDGEGNIVQELDMPPETYQVPRFDDGDVGVAARCKVADTNGDGLQEILLYNRTHFWQWAQT